VVEAAVMAGEAAVTDLAAEVVTDSVVVTHLPEEAITDSVVVTHLPEEAVTDSVVVTHLPEEAVTGSVVVTHLADSPAVALVRDSAERGDFLTVDFLVTEITAALVITVSVDGIATFAILMGALSISAVPALDIQITPTITPIRTTTTMGI
jgi:hypothetical protein